jgi:PTS system mannose-specific IID component
MARHEVDRPEEAARTMDEMRRFKRAAVSAFAAWGDRFFWGTLRPAATGLGVLLVLVAGAWGAVTWLIVYNAAHLHHRYHGLSDGYRFGPGVASRVAGSSLRRLPDRVRPIGLVAVGALVPVSLAAGKVAFSGVPALAFPAAGLMMALVLHGRGGLGWSWGFLAVLFGFGWAFLMPGR